MRLRTLNRLSQVSSAVVTALLLQAGCHVRQAASQQQNIPSREPSTISITPATVPSTAPDLNTTQVSAQPLTQPSATLPTTLPTTLPGGALLNGVTTQPATVPAIAPATQLVIQPITQPVTQPATQTTSQANNLATPATLPATEPAIQTAVEPVAPPIADQVPPSDPDQILADQTLAEQLDNIAELQFAGKSPSDQTWPLMLRQQAALLGACAALNPASERFPRLVADAMSQLRDSTAESAALQKAIAINPGDEFSWNRRLELILAPMQNARQKIDYLRDVIGRSAGDVIVPPNVRAHAAFRCAQLLLERGEENAAQTVLANALRDTPSSVECLTLRYQMLPATATRFERCGQLLDLLHANPLQAQYSEGLADEIADAGLVQECLPWYQLAVSTLHLQGDPGQHSMLNWAAELYIGEETADAIKLNSALLQIDPTYTSAYFLQLVMVRSTDDKDALTKTLQEATNALSNRVIDAVNAAAPTDASRATTRPISDESPLQLPDLGPTVDRITKGVSPLVKQQFVEAVADMALLEGYFAEDEVTASKLIDALAGVLPADAPELARLRGWNDLLAKKTDDAKAKFTTVATQDPLAELGLVKAMLDSPTDHTVAESMGRRLLQDHPSGLIGAMLYEQLHGDRVKLITTTQADALREAVIQFPTALLELVQKPQNFYAIRVDPHPVGSYLGEPLLADVSVRNISDYDLTIGPDGVLKPDLLFRLEPKLDKSPSFSAYDTIAGPTVLASHETTNQTVRLDQTQLLAYLSNQDLQQFEISGTLGANEMVHGLGGYRVQFVKGFFRLPSGFSPEHEQAQLKALTSGRPDQKITALSLLYRYILQLEQTKDPDMNVRQHVAGLIDMIHKARQDPLLAVSAWAGHCQAALSPESDRADLIRDMTDAPDWRQRQIALLLVPNLPVALRDQLFDKLSLDTQSSVRAEAVALKALVALPPEATTQPADTTTPPPQAAPAMP
jgi:tetratricopeptide (TPR) repeat protein